MYHSIWYKSKAVSHPIALLMICINQLPPKHRHTQNVFVLLSKITCNNRCNAVGMSNLFCDAAGVCYFRNGPVHHVP